MICAFLLAGPRAAAADHEDGHVLVIRTQRVQPIGCMKTIYEPNAKLLVLSADSFNHSLPPASQLNHVPWTRIYGDGRVVFVDRDKGDAEIEAGRSSKWCKPLVHAVTLDSSYMIPPVGSCRHIRVSYNDDPAAAGSTIQFDRNSMSPNELGDIGITTLMWCAPQPATYTLLETQDDKRLFSATVSGYSGANLQLVVIGDPAKPTGGRLLELDDHGAIQNIHWLQAAPQS